MQGSNGLATDVVRLWWSETDLAKLVGQHVTENQGVRRVGDEVAITSHDLHFVNLVAVEGLEDDSSARGQILDNHLQQTQPN